MGSKLRRLKGKLRETGFKGGVDVIDDKKERKKINKREGILRKIDFIFKKFLFLLDESWDKFDVGYYKFEFGRIFRFVIVLFVMFDDYFVDILFCIFEVGVYIEMIR